MSGGTVYVCVESLGLKVGCEVYIGDLSKTDPDEVQILALVFDDTDLPDELLERLLRDKEWASSIEAKAIERAAI